jgi:hypothetical protein
MHDMDRISATCGEPTAGIEGVHPIHGAAVLLTVLTQGTCKECTVLPWMREYGGLLVRWDCHRHL